MPQNVLEIEALTKSFRSPESGMVPILDIAEFRLAAGSECALEGGSGTGKTTLLNVIAGITSPDAGRVMVAGRDMAGMGEGERDAWRSRKIGYVFQTFNLLQGYTALENVELALWLGGGGPASRARAMLERVGLGARMHHLPRQLSVGQQQRVAVARALVGSPELVLADEPTGNLDRRHAVEALELIRGVCRDAGAALLIVSHDPAVLSMFARREALASFNRALAAQEAAT